jgi:hypothetical protein
MVTEDFGKFVASQQDAGAEDNSDWAEVRAQWLKDLDSLYSMIAGFLQEYIDLGSIHCDFSEIELTEPNLGTYSAKRMDIRIGRLHVSLAPVGRLLIGCTGGVNIEGSAGRAQILRVREKVRTAADLVKFTWILEGDVPPSLPPQEQIPWAWKILTNGSPRAFVGLDKESFFQLLMEIANA